MLEILYTYLIQRKSLFLPGIGHFRVETRFPSYDAATQSLLPPGTGFIMTDEQPPTQKQLFDYIARKKNITELEAIQQFNTCLFEMRQQLKSGNSVEWAGVGVISAGDNVSETILLPFHGGAEYFKPVPAPRIVRKGGQHAMVVGDRQTDTVQMQEELMLEVPKKPVHWGWWALALGLTGIALLAWHFYRYPGSFTGNHQTIPLGF